MRGHHSNDVSVKLRESWTLSGHFVPAVQHRVVDDVRAALASKNQKHQNRRRNMEKIIETLLTMKLETMLDNVI